MSLKPIPISTRVLSRMIVILAITCALAAPALAQTTDGGTDINNTASASYSDGSNSYNVSSNTVTVRVSNVAGLVITPDAGALGSQVVAGQTGVLYTFTVTNTGNFSDRVQFLASGASIRLSGTASASITRAVIDTGGTPNQIDGTDTDIKTNAGVVTSAVMARNTSIRVLVEVSVGAGATAGQTVIVTLGDAQNRVPAPAPATGYDSLNADGTANEVRTSHPAGVTVVNGDATNHNVEAQGDITATVQTDAQLQLSLTAPAGPVPLGSNITYAWQLCNIGSRAAKSVTLTTVNGGGSNQGVFIFAPVPANTVLAATQSFPGGVGVLYSSSNPALNPITQMTWETVRPATVTMVAFNVATPLNGGTLAASPTCSPSINMVVTITTTDATNAITEQGNAYANNSLDVQLPPAVSPLRTTTLLQSGGVLNGPQGAPGAVGTNTNDDFTDKSVNPAAIANVPAYPAPANVTVAVGTATFTNTVQNTGNANDTYTLSITSYPAGADVTIIVGATSTPMVVAGSPVVGAAPTIAVAYNATANYQVVVSLPVGKTVLTGFSTVIRATSGIDNTQTNDTIDRLFTGFIKLEKAVSVNNTTGVGAATDAVPGAVLTYTITYTNIATSAGGAGCVKLTANNLIITENGTAGGNNWATYTSQTGSPTDPGGAIVVNGPPVTIITDTVASVAAGATGTLTFQRTIN